MTPEAVLAPDGRGVRISWPDGPSLELSARWLFDHADGAREAVSGQRTHGAGALQGASRIEAAGVEDEALVARFAPSGERRRIGLGRLRAEAAVEGPRIDLWRTPEPIAAAAPIPFRDYLDDDSALREALSRVVRWGLVLLEGAGQDARAVERAVARFGYIRETNYGRIFDVRIEPVPENLAFTDRVLDLHTDNPYRDPVPTLQLLHALVSDEGGGETLFVDGFAHAEVQRLEAPGAFRTLAERPARFSFTAPSGARWSATWPILDLWPGGAVRAVRLNHRSLDLPPGESGATEAWYDAYLDLYRRLHAPEAAFERRLRPGDVVIFDNRRIVHGRRGLTQASPRWLRGCYADQDGLAAALARLDHTEKESADAHERGG